MPILVDPGKNITGSVAQNMGEVMEIAAPDLQRDSGAVFLFCFFYKF
jgi:hypothetical protein